MIILISNRKKAYELFGNEAIYDIDVFKKENFLDSDEINDKIIKRRLVKDLHGVDGDLKNMTQEFMDAVFEDADTKDEWRSSDILNGCIGSILQKNAGGKFKESIESSNKALNDAICVNYVLLFYVEISHFLSF